MLPAMTKEENMSRLNRAASTWPFLLALAALLALCITAPRAWQRTARTSGWTSALSLGDQGEPTLAPPKKKRQVIVGQDGVGVDTELPSAIEAATTELPYVTRHDLERLPAAPSAADRDMPTKDAPSLATPVVAYPQARFASQPVTTPDASPGLVHSMIHDSRSAATDFAGRLPTMTGPVKELVDRFTETVTQDPLSLMADEIAPERTALRPSRPELPTPSATTDAAGRPGISLPKIELQPESDTNPSVVKPAVMAAWWPTPNELLNQLEQLRWTAEAGAWTMDVKVLLIELSRESGPRTPRAIEIVAELSDLLSQLNLIIVQVRDQSLADKMRLTGYSLSRRLDLWACIPELWLPTADSQLTPDPARLNECVLQVAALTQQNPKGSEWRDYLLIDALKELAARRDTAKSEQQQMLVQRVLGRLDHGMKAWQQQFASATPLASLRQELRRWGHQRIDPRQVLADIEQFEQSAAPSDARIVAAAYRRLAASPQPAEQQLARQMETHYRNANLRLTFTADLVNRFLPPQQPRTIAVNDMMMGLPTRGWSRTHTDVHVRFLPDPSRVRMALEAHGKIFSQTYTVSGPVTAHSEADSSFYAAKELQLNIDGLQAGKTEVSAETFPRLKRIQSKLDPVPLLRSIVQSVARTEYDESQPKAQAEARRKISREVRTNMDEEIAGYIRNGNAFFKDRITAPLTELGLTPDLIESQTTRDRCTMRLRMADAEQLAGHGPRPRAPSDSLASMQLHESVINNICQQFDWDGKTYTMLELRDQVAAKLKTTLELNDEENLADLHLTFAPQDAVRVHCRDGRLELNLAFARLRKGRQSWKDFQVRVLYKPDLEQRGAPLCRDGTVQLMGDRLNTGAQIALRGIFSKAFPPSRSWKLIPDKLVAAKPGLADVVVSQCDIRNGWIGVALALRPEAKTAPVVQQQPSPPHRTGLLPLLHR